MNDRYADIKKLENTIIDQGLKYVGKRIINRESEMKAAGETIYIDDMRIKGMIFGKILFSPFAHAKIIKTSKQVQMRKMMDDNNNSCPECGGESFGGLVRTVSYGFLHLKERKSYPMTCCKCDCEWELS